jgi:hypothetical protein
VRFKSSSPAYWSLLYGSATGDRFAAASQRLHEDIARQIAGMLRRLRPELAEDRALLMGTMTLSVVKAVMPMITTATPERSAELVDELKLVLLRYLS